MRGAHAKAILTNVLTRLDPVCESQSTLGCTVRFLRENCKSRDYTVKKKRKREREKEKEKRRVAIRADSQRARAGLRAGLAKSCDFDGPSREPWRGIFRIRVAHGETLARCVRHARMRAHREACAGNLCNRWHRRAAVQFRAVSKEEALCGRRYKDNFDSRRMRRD